MFIARFFVFSLWSWALGNTAQFPPDGLSFLAKSQVSAAIKNLEARGCLRREYQLENRKTAHLRLCDPAQPIIAAGRSAQEQFGAALLDGFTPEELEHMQRSMERIRKNVEKYLEDKNNDNVD